MKKGLPIIIIAIVVVAVAFIAWNFLGKGGISLPVGEIKKEAGESGEEFIGKIKDVVALGAPMKCTYSQGNMSGTSYIKGKNMYGEITTGEGNAYMIVKDNCMWNWGMQESQGFKSCFEEDFWEMNEEYAQEGQASMPTEAEYRCVPAVFPDSKFDPPGNINFMTMEEMMEGMMGE